MRFRAPWQSSVDRFVRGDVGKREDAADLRSDPLPLLRIAVEDGDSNALAASARAVASPKPEAAPVTIAAILLSSFMASPFGAAPKGKDVA
jgi:hypothetical protein